jgi:hypothetical protein
MTPIFEHTVELTLECASTDLFRHIAVEFFVNDPLWDPDAVELTTTTECETRLGTTGREMRSVSARRFVTNFTINVFRADQAFSPRRRAEPWRGR